MTATKHYLTVDLPLDLIEQLAKIKGQSAFVEKAIRNYMQKARVSA